MGFCCARVGREIVSRMWVSGAGFLSGFLWYRLDLGDGVDLCRLDLGFLEFGGRSGSFGCLDLSSDSLFWR